ncbi:hypothetical protein DL770_010552 [Monosporascus sp. CRB-9-2]|nr:hypothetical protein DL770_010552 [Monosporascus sp. CRB-9-2]
MGKDLYAMTDVTSQGPRNWHLPDKIQHQQGCWLKTLPLERVRRGYADHSFGRRIRALQGVDEIIEDVINKPDERGSLDNTYIIFTKDNGYYISNHRIPTEKALFCAEDSDLSFVVRGPGVPAGKTTAQGPVAPVLGRPEAAIPSGTIPMPLTGKSSGGRKRTLDVEFWGFYTVEAPNAPALGVPFRTNSYKTLRNVDEDESWLYSHWCTGETELYNGAEDPYELNNLALNQTPEHARLVDRLKAIFLVTKPCAKSTCRQRRALLSAADERTGSCRSSGRCTRERRGTRYLENAGQFGTWERRHAILADIGKTARELTDGEISGNATTVQRRDLGIVDFSEWMQWIE